MKTLTLLLILSGISTATAQVINPANGHTYILTSQPGDVFTARAEAVSAAAADRAALGLERIEGLSAWLESVGLAERRADVELRADKPFPGATPGIGLRSPCGGHGWV